LSLSFILFLPKEKSADAHGIICETYSENVTVIRTCANWFKRFKNDYFDISDKECSGRSAVVKEDELRKDEKKLWKTMKNTIRLICCIDFFFIVIKKLQ